MLELRGQGGLGCKTRRSGVWEGATGWDRGQRPPDHAGSGGHLMGLKLEWACVDGILCLKTSPPVPERSVVFARGLGVKVGHWI